MSDKDDKEDYEPQVPKRTRKTKVPTPPATNRSTRRAKRKDSSEENTLPEVIPRNQFESVEIKQTFESQVSRLIIQVPMSEFTKQSFSHTQLTRVENVPLQIQTIYEKDNICCKLKLPEEVDINEDHTVSINVHGKYSWLAQNTITSKHIKVVRKMLSKNTWEQFGWIKVPTVNSDFFIILTFRKEEELSDQHFGLVNQGNTCYMNSYLQMLFNLPEFRKIIFAAATKQPDRFPATLQMLFYRMLTEGKPGSPEELIKSFGWSKKDAQVQQDVQEFSCLFFDILERKVVVLDRMGCFGSVGELFCGQLTHYIQCVNVENHERFFDLHLPLMPTLTLSLDLYIEEQELSGDNKYHTDYYGHQDARKGLRISKLPPVLMLQLKRFQYNYNTESNEKMLGQCRYPEQLDLSKWTTEPQKPKPYQLYAVLVHEGSMASSGHYYVFIKTKKQWIKFNDQRVEKATREKATHYNYGGQSDSLEYNTKEMKIKFKKHHNKATAYMLVYVSKVMHPNIFDQTGSFFPQWLIDKTKERKEIEEQKKIRKQSICDIPVLKWSNQFLANSANTGFISKQILDSSQEKIEYISKSAKIDEWISQLPKDQTDQQVYLYWMVQDRQVLINLNCRGNSSAKQIFNEITDPVIIYAPLATTKEEYLVIVKQFTHEDQDSQLIYSKLTSIRKDALGKDLFKLMRSLYKEEQNRSFYIEDRKQGLIRLKETSSDLLPVASPTRNQLMIVLVEQLKKEEESGQLQLWYKEQMDNIKIIIQSEENKEASWDKELNKYVTVAQIRQIIFDQMLPEDSHFQSPSNIVVRYRAKKTSKLLTEASDDEKLKDIIKSDKLIYFSYSALKTNERLTQKQLIFYYRPYNSLQLSDLQKIVVARKNESSVVDLIFTSELVKEFLPPRIGHQYRMFLLSKDRSYINDIVDEKGYVHKKGELINVLERQKHSALVIQQFDMPETEDQIINVLVHHVAKTGEKMGYPRWEYTISSGLLSSLKYYILEKIQKDQIEFEGKVHQINPIKVRVMAYLKQFGSAEQLPQPSELMNGEESKDQTIKERFGSPRILRVGVVHNGISKSQQALKLHVQ